MPNFSFLVVTVTGGALIGASLFGATTTDLSDTVSNAAKQSRGHPSKQTEGARAGPSSLSDVAKPEMQ